MSAEVVGLRELSCLFQTYKNSQTVRDGEEKHLEETDMSQRLKIVGNER